MQRKRVKKKWKANKKYCRRVWENKGKKLISAERKKYKKWMKSRVQQRRVNHDEKESKNREKKRFWKRMSESVYNKKE